MSQVPLLGEVLGAFLATQAAQKGLFEVEFDRDVLQRETGMPKPVSAEPEKSRIDTCLDSSVDAIHAHHLWTIFLLEAWQVGPLMLLTHPAYGASELIKCRVPATSCGALSGSEVLLQQVAMLVSNPAAVLMKSAEAGQQYLNGKFSPSCDLNLHRNAVL